MEDQRGNQRVRQNLGTAGQLAFRRPCEEVAVLEVATFPAGSCREVAQSVEGGDPILGES